jgi:hypothetical protein
MNSLPMTKEIQDKINMLLDKDFLVRETALVSIIRDRLLNAVTRGEFVPYWSEVNELVSAFNSTIERLKFSKPITESINYDDANPEPLFDNMSKYKLDVKSVTLYKGTDDKNMIVQIQGFIL